ncbi:DNA processing protein [Agromyces flavus]|uniref:DNA processing protein n=1 Tax=Agromyces flavus TaxID=589382 RepID=A0A1H1Q399_9MICO|nr:DNA-processing protein DprA [Agromyces flavus]MCP2367815.1 DNA processing protein [Agromyces flavus]GGI47275.1 DNA processing protein DprA [Agromyces flavus]SDS17737.1 DNA protecting protein DprA [Agromyces flavus]
MSRLETTAADVSEALLVLRGADDPAPASTVVAAAILGYVSEPGDGVLGRIIDALGVEWTAASLIEHRPESEWSASLVEHGAEVAARELVAGLDRWRPRVDHAAFVRTVEQAARVRARLLIPSDAAWPDGLRGLEAHGPRALWVRGRVDALAESPSIALVGARAASHYGEHVTVEAAAGLVDRGFAIVSGGAYGIDGAAHRSALASGGTTVAFLAGGVDRFYPVGHEALLGRVADTGAVVSELPCGAAPTRWRFLQRNRLIAAAADATVVLEAGIRSGSLNTAGHAAALGRPLGAVPGPVTSPASAGCHRLLREFDAVCVTDASQMAELVAARLPAEASQGEGLDGAALGDGITDDGATDDGAILRRVHGALDDLTEAERRVFDALGVRRSRTVSELAERSRLGTGAVLGGLGALEATGLARRVADGWVRRRSA